MKQINPKELIQISKTHYEREKRDIAYNIARKIIEDNWEKNKKRYSVTEGVAVLVLIWNMAAYRGSAPHFKELEKLIKNRETDLKEYRGREVQSFNSNDHQKVKTIFSEVLEATKYGGKRSPVGVAKALHILAPRFFPLWDGEIAESLGCGWGNDSPSMYINFIQKVKRSIQQITSDYGRINKISEDMAKKKIIEECSKNSDYEKSLLKILDEYFYEVFKK